jgi:hypothetical protein
MTEAEKELLIEILYRLHQRVLHLENWVGTYEGSPVVQMIEKLERLFDQKGMQRQCQAK